jgi:hypothetical protein
MANGRSDCEPRSGDVGVSNSGYVSRMSVSVSAPLASFEVVGRAALGRS